MALDDGLEAEPQVVAWAERRGYEGISSRSSSCCSFGDEQPPAPPAGVEIVEVTPELHEAAYALSREAWEDLPLDIPVELSPFEVWLEEDLRPDRFSDNGER